MSANNRIKTIEKRIRKANNKDSLEERIKFLLFEQQIPREIRDKYELNRQIQDRKIITLQEWEVYRGKNLANGKTETEIKEMEDKIKEVGGFEEVVFVLDENPTKGQGQYI